MVELGPEDWPQWRDASGMGVTPTAVPTTWGPEEGVRWTVELPGEGNSSPIVVGRRAYLTTVGPGDEGGELAVVAVDLDRGEIAWRTVVLGGRRGRPDPHNTYAAATPASDGKRVFAFFGSHLVALDLAGRQLWSTEADPLFGQYLLHGPGSSPIVVGDSVVVAHDRENTEKPAGWLAAFDVATGEERWRTVWSDTCCSYATPIVRSTAAGPEILFFHSNWIRAYAPADGRVLWQVEVDAIQPVPTPVMEGDLLAAVGGAAITWSNSVYRLSGVGEATRAELLWTTRKGVAKSASPVLHEGRLYLVTDGGMVFCHDAESGRVIWRKRLGDPGYLASPVIAGDQLLLPNEYGRTKVLRPANRYQLLADNELGDVGRNNASPAVGGGCLLLRTGVGLTCVGLPEAAGPAG